MVVSIPLGTLNALVNLAIWIVTSVCAFFSERIYKRISSLELQRSGVTRSTDASEISPTYWIFGHFRKRLRSPVWWAILLLLLNFALLPLEILLEAGIDENKRCTPKTVVSEGLCASPWKGHSELGISAASLLTQRFDWVDKEWHHVLVGSSKTPNSQEVRVSDKLLDINRSYLVKDCTSKTRSCSGETGCGTLTVIREQGPYDTIVKDWSYMPKGVISRGDLTYDKATGVVFIFWETGSAPGSNHLYFNRSHIFVEGIESVLSNSEIERVLLGSYEPWTLKLDERRTRIYTISCTTDGLLSSDLARAVSLVRCYPLPIHQ